MKDFEREPFWHTTSHVLAQAVRELYPEARLGTGPAIEEGFYYDFFRPTPFTPEDLRRIEKRMREIVALDQPVLKREFPRPEAERLLREAGETFKLELLAEIPGETVTFFGQGDFFDLCAGPHLSSTGAIGALALLSVAASCWRADESRESMQRIYGISFPDQARLDEFLRLKQEARERDHRRLGVELDLFSFQDRAGPGMIFWHPRGARVRRLIEDLLCREQEKRGYQFLYTPHLAEQSLWETSGHLDFYRQYMFPVMETEQRKLLVKPMNCPGHILVYQSRRRSYRELPLRWAELGTVYRFEKSGVLHGLMRVRGFTQDDAHIFCRPEQLESEIRGALALVVELLGLFGFSDFEVFLSTRPEKFVGSPENWDRATGALRSAVEAAGLAYEVDPGEGVFYGPKIDVKIRDVLGRSWQCSTIQVDFNLPERFGLEYQGPEGTRERPVMIHRALLGSLERFFGILIEHYKGAFPFWLAPVQVAVLPVGDAQGGYAGRVLERLREAGLRAEMMPADETLGRRIRAAETEKIPVMAVLGAREEEAGTVTLRTRGSRDQESVSLERLAAVLRERETLPGPAGRAGADPESESRIQSAEGVGQPKGGAR